MFFLFHLKYNIYFNLNLNEFLNSGREDNENKEGWLKDLLN